LIRCIILILPNVRHLAGVCPGLLTLTLRGTASIRQERRDYVGKPAQTSGMTERCINEARL
jgi:hypothetical protein